MALTYGFVKCKAVTTAVLKPSRVHNEIQYHLNVTLQVPSGNGTQLWDSAINVGTDNSEDLLQYRIALDFAHPVITTLQAAAPGFTDLTGAAALPALDFLRSDVLANTGKWRLSDVMDGSLTQEPAATLSRLLERARQSAADVYLFGRTYTGGDLGMHDVHLNQGSTDSAPNHHWDRPSPATSPPATPTDRTPHNLNPTFDSLAAIWSLAAQSCREPPFKRNQRIRKREHGTRPRTRVGLPRW